MGKIPVAVQMYTLREESQKNFFETLKKVAELGFDGVELAGYGGNSVLEVKEMLSKLGLKAAGNHVPLEDLQHHLIRVIKDQKILENQYIVCPFLFPHQRGEEDYKELVSLLNKAGEVCNREGITLCYHNHDFELELLSDGRTALDTIFMETNPEYVKAEFDVYWLTKASKDPVEWLKRYKHRTPLVHLKDMTLDDEKFFAELGTGGVNLEGVLNLGEENNVQWWIVEQDVCLQDPFESIKISIDYLKKMNS
ncbi:sugar phosphate isomerase/epimerase family protein [Bacillus sp. REN16]|uniref:sugar phosphate isomerase/epimerase family protein n=1 Tax=Bacillus sp. REN16 TaxID=2887296 RepID=UPI001E559EDE|nr:sugar phosphate isomerase/epimerase [Bacillus sp. REN16]MCC3355948.1 sugar phosphate isomerase/epimerase [Bacillus sp. REN16]